MLPNFEKFTKELASKPSWGAKELTSKIQKISNEIEAELEETGKVISVTSAKKNRVTALKKYDILYLPLVGIPHYFMVHRIVEKKVYGIIFSSKDKHTYTLHEVEKDRVLAGSFASTAYLCVDLEEAKKSFIRTYEDKKEGNLIFKKVISHYQQLFK